MTTTTRPSRRALHARALSLTLSLAFASLALAPASAVHAADATKTLRIGYQKSASLFVLQKAQGTLERRLAAQGVALQWIEFPAGPQLLEGLNVGSIDVGFVGEAPPIFAQAAGARFVYVGYDPAAPQAEAIVVPKDSGLKSVADLKGRRVALNKGSNVNYLIVKALEKAGLKYSDITPVYLPPADARAAFERGAVDAWAIWDPFLAAAEKQLGVRQLADGRGIVNNFAYYLAASDYVKANPRAIRALFDDTVDRAKWLAANRRQAAAVIAPLQGLDADVVETSLARYQFGVQPVTPAIASEQQKLADVFLDLKLIPKPIRIADAVGTVAW